MFPRINLGDKREVRFFIPKHLWVKKVRKRCTPLGESTACVHDISLLLLFFVCVFVWRAAWTLPLVMSQMDMLNYTSSALHAYYLQGCAWCKTWTRLPQLFSCFTQRLWTSLINCVVWFKYRPKCIKVLELVMPQTEIFLNGLDKHGLTVHGMTVHWFTVHEFTVHGFTVQGRTSPQYW